MNRLKDLTVLQAVQLTAAVLAGLLVLLLLVGAVWAMRLPPAPVVLPSADSLQAAVISLPEPGSDSLYLTGRPEEPGSQVSPDALSVMAARPLFWQERRPVPEADEAQVEERVVSRPSELDKVELTGVYFAGEASGITVRLSGKRQRVAIGEELLGWTLESVKPDAVRFTNAGQERIIQLEHQQGSSTRKSAPVQIPAAPEQPLVAPAQTPNQ